MLQRPASEIPSAIETSNNPIEPSTEPIASRAISSASTTSSPSRAKRWLKGGFVVTLIIAVLAASGAYWRDTSTGTVIGASMTHRVTRGDLMVTVTEKGTLESSNNVEVRSKVWGWKTVNWVVESGTEVQKDDLLVELDGNEMEKKVDDAKINYHNARADMITAEADVSVAEKSIDEYLEATFKEERGTILQEIFDAEQAVTQAELAHRSTTRLVAKGLIKSLQLQGDKFKLDSARQKLEIKKTALKSLTEFKKQKEVEILESGKRAAEAKLEAAKAAVALAETNVRQHEQQLSYHTIRAPQDGMVIHPKAAAHRDAPDVEEGANVHTNQVLLIMPDLNQMQVKLGIHESMIDRVHTGLPAKVTVGEMTMVGEVTEVAKVTKPATWYTGNVVKFDTVVSIETPPGLKPGLSAEVEVVIAEHSDVLTIPVAAVVENGEYRYCWVNSRAGGAQRRQIQLGDTNDQFVVVKDGLKEGEDVVLNPVAYLDEAQIEAMQTSNEAEQKQKAKEAKSVGQRPAQPPLQPASSE